MRKLKKIETLNLVLVEVGKNDKICNLIFIYCLDLCHHQFCRSLMSVFLMMETLRTQFIAILTWELTRNLA